MGKSKCLRSTWSFTLLFPAWEVKMPVRGEAAARRGCGSEGLIQHKMLCVGIQWCVWLGREQALEPCAPPKPDPAGKQGVG